MQPASLLAVRSTLDDSDFSCTKTTIWWHYSNTVITTDRRPAPGQHSFSLMLFGSVSTACNNANREQESSSAPNIIAQWMFLHAVIGSESGSRRSNFDSTLFVHLHNFTQVLCPPSPLCLLVCSWSFSPPQASHNFTVTQLFTSLLDGNHGELTSRPGTA